MSWSQGVAEKSRFAFFTIPSISVVNTSETFSRDSVTVTNGAGINVTGTFTLPALSPRALPTLGVSEVSVLAELTARPNTTSRTLGTDGTLRMSGELVTLPSFVLPVVLDLRTGTDRAVVRSPQGGVTVEPVSTDLAVVSARVVRAVADSGLLIAVIRVAVTVAGNTPGKRSPVVLVTFLTFLTELSSVAVRAGTSLHPGGCLPLTSFLRGLQDKLVNCP